MWNIQQGNKRRKNKHNVESNLKALALSLSDRQEELFTNIHCIVPSEYLEAAVIRLQISLVIRTFLILGKHRLSQSIRPDLSNKVQMDEKWERDSEGKADHSPERQQALKPHCRFWHPLAVSAWGPADRKRERELLYCHHKTHVKEPPLIHDTPSEHTTKQHCWLFAVHCDVFKDVLFTVDV